MINGKYISWILFFSLFFCIPFARATYKQPPTLKWIPDYPGSTPYEQPVPQGAAPVLSVAGDRETTSSFYGSAAASTHFATSISENRLEYQDTFVLPSPLQLNYVRGGLDIGSTYFAEASLNNIGSDDHSYSISLRNPEKMDLSTKWEKSYWYSSGQPLRGLRQEASIGGYLRGLEHPHGYLGLRQLKEQGTTDTGARDTKLESMWIGFISSSNTMSISGGIYSDDFQDHLNHENTVNALSLGLGLDKIIGGKNHILFHMDHNRASKEDTTENDVNTTFTLTGIASGPLKINDLKLKGKVRYLDKPSSFVENMVPENLFETNLSFVYVNGSGSLAGGTRSREFTTTRLARQSIEDFMESGNGTHPTIHSMKISEKPDYNTSWINGTVNEGKSYKITAGYSVNSRETLSSTDFVSAGSAGLTIDRRERQDIKFIIKPRSPFNLSLSQRREDRQWRDSRRQIAGTSAIETNAIICNLPPIGRFSGAIDQSRTVMSYPDEDGSFVHNDDIVATGIHSGMTINSSWRLFVDHTIMESNGFNESKEENTVFGLAYESTSSDGICFDIRYGRDTFTDRDDPTRSFYAKSLTLSTKAAF